MTLEEFDPPTRYHRLHPKQASRLVELRTYTLKPGTRTLFHTLVRDRSVPLQRNAGLDVLVFGRCAHDASTYQLMRAFDGVEQMEASLEAFHASPAWQHGPRGQIEALIETDARATFWLTLRAVDAIRLSLGL